MAELTDSLSRLHFIATTNISTLMNSSCVPVDLGLGFHVICNIFFVFFEAYFSLVVVSLVVNWLPVKTRLWNDSLCVDRDVKVCSFSCILVYRWVSSAVSFQSWGVAARLPVPNYIASWQMHIGMCVNVLPRIITWSWTAAFDSWSQVQQLHHHTIQILEAQLTVAELVKMYLNSSS